MKLLWIKTDFLHPTNRGGQIRTLGTLSHLHERHEVHYLAYHDPANEEALPRSSEYCSKAYPVPFPAPPPRRSPAFALQAVLNLFSPLPLAVSRYCSPQMRRAIDELIARESFDSIVCDFPFVAPNLGPHLSRCVLFAHNVETVIWQRQADTAPDPVRRAYFRMQAGRMFRLERDVCRTVAHTIAVSAVDAAHIREMFGVSSVTAVPTGVDVDYFAPQPARPAADLVFVGSMDWMPNIDGVRYFVTGILPRIRAVRPDCSLAIVGRRPTAEIRGLADADPRITVTGTVADVRPWLWGSKVSVVPLRIGGGTRLKIYEAMAARLPVVSTSIGAEGLDVRHPDNIRLADSPEDFARQCVRLLESENEREALARAAWNLVSERYSWRSVTRQFEAVLAAHPASQQTQLR